MYSMHFRLPKWQRNEAALNKISREYGKEKIMEGDFCMKKFLALLMTVAMVLSLVAVPTLADTPEVDPTEPLVSDAGWYFETDPEDEGWYWLDEDGDGNEWQWMLGAVEMNIPEGEGMMNSQSFINYVGPLTPDNWLVSPVFEAGTQVSFMMVGQDPAYAAEYIGVYVSVDGG